MTNIDVEKMTQIKELQDNEWEIKRVSAVDKYMGTRGDYRDEITIVLLKREHADEHSQNNEKIGGKL